ncbi:hypothetical protein AMECASPLE_000851 [Ameca splendens]|uniref:Uncharacterized protein n=1 Tax=Ameca splendens TaxID=208324 RepID=A0ABV0YK99_9TELE
MTLPRGLGYFQGRRWIWGEAGMGPLAEMQREEGIWQQSDGFPVKAGPEGKKEPSGPRWPLRCLSRRQGGQGKGDPHSMERMSVPVKHKSFRGFFKPSVKSLRRMSRSSVKSLKGPSQTQVVYCQVFERPVQFMPQAFNPNSKVQQVFWSSSLPALKIHRLMVLSILQISLASPIG